MRATLIVSLSFAACGQSPIVIGQDVATPTGTTPGTTFSAQTIATGKQPIDVISGDFDGDGRIDLVTDDNMSQQLSFFAGIGHGAFAPAVARPGAFGLLATADLDGDRHLDLVVGESATAGAHGIPPATANLLAVLLGNGDGTFRDGATYGDSSESIGPGGLALADLNADGKPDVVYTRADTGSGGFDTPDHFLAIRLGNGNGTFGAEQLYDTIWSGPEGVAIGDFNGDHRLDIVVAGGGILFYAGRGDGTVAPAVAISQPAPCRAVVARDFDGDGKLDLVTADCSKGDIDVPFADLLRGNGDGTFAAATQLPVGQSGVLFSPLAAGDFDGNGTVDLAVPDFSFGFLTVIYDVARAPFVGTLAVDHEPRVSRAVDVNGDGRLDILVVNELSNTISVLINGAAVE